MKAHRLLTICAVAMVTACPAVAQQTWKPERPVEIVLGSAAGNSIDRMARLVQRMLQEKKLVETPVVVSNKPGAGNTIAWNYVNSRAGDGHTIMVSNLNLSLGHLTGTTPYSYRDFTPLCILFHEYVVFAVRADSPIKDGRDLIDRLRKDPGAASFGLSSVLGGANHVATALAARAGGADVRKLRVVVFDSAAKAMTAMLGGHLDVVAASASVPVPHIESGKVRIIATSAPRRLSGVYASAPTWREQGVEATLSNYRGFIGPRGLSPAQVAFWERAFAAVDQDPAWRADLERNQLAGDFTGSRDTRKYFDDIAGPLKSVLDELGLSKPM